MELVAEVASIHTVNETMHSSLLPSLPLLVTGAEDIITITPSILLAGTD
jgi:hypothetical protein